MWQILAQHTAMKLGLLELKQGHYVQAWDKRPEDDVSCIVLECKGLRGLPGGLFARRPGDAAITFVNPNKMQLMAPGGVSAMCQSLLAGDLLGAAFVPEYRGCLCQTDQVGAVCPRPA